MKACQRRARVSDGEKREGHGSLCWQADLHRLDQEQVQLLASNDAYRTMWDWQILCLQNHRF